MIAIANGEPGNLQMVTLALKNRSRAAYGWHHDAQRMEHSGPDGAPVAIETTARNTIDVSRMSAEDRQALRGILMRIGECNDDQPRIGRAATNRHGGVFVYRRKSEDSSVWAPVNTNWKSAAPLPSTSPWTIVAVARVTTRNSPAVSLKPALPMKAKD